MLEHSVLQSFMINVSEISYGGTAVHFKAFVIGNGLQFSRDHQLRLNFKPVFSKSINSMKTFLL